MLWLWYYEWESKVIMALAFHREGTMLRTSLTVAAVLLLCASCAFGVVWIVDDAGGGDFWTIQEAVLTAAESDLIEVRPGIYTGPLNRNIDFGGKNLTVYSSDGPEVTIIDCENLARAFYFHSAEWITSVVEGLTITRGYADEGAGIYCTEFSSCTIRNCIITDCHATLGGMFGGGGVCCRWESSTRMYDCTLRGNTSSMFGGGAVFMDGAEPIIEGCVFEDNETAISGGGLYVYYNADATITTCTFAGNTSAYHGGGILISQADADIQDCTFYGNTAAGLGGGIHAYESSPLIARTIVSHSIDGEGITCSGVAVPSYPSIYNCDVFGNADGDSLCGSYFDNLYVDPLYCDPTVGDLSLCTDSPCLPNNNGWAVTMGGIGQGCEECATGIAGSTEETSWGVIKAMFR